MGEHEGPTSLEKEAILIKQAVYQGGLAIWCSIQVALTVPGTIFFSALALDSYSYPTADGSIDVIPFLTMGACIAWGTFHLAWKRRLLR